MLAISLSLFGFCACGDKKIGEGTTENSAENTAVAIAYEQISQDEAKRIMDTEDGFVIIDARTEEEFSEGHIEGAILIPEYEIAERAEKEIPEKDRLLPKRQTKQNRIRCPRTARLHQCQGIRRHHRLAVRNRKMMQEKCCVFVIYCCKLWFFVVK